IAWLPSSSPSGTKKPPQHLSAKTTPLFHHNLFFRSHFYLRLTPVNLDSTNDLHLLTLKIRQTRISRFRRVLRDPNHEGHIRIIPPEIEKRVPILTFENLSNRPLNRNVLPNMVNRFRIGNNRPRFDGACQPPNPADQGSKLDRSQQHFHTKQNSIPNLCRSCRLYDATIVQISPTFSPPH